jgi:hypothetical protein
MTSVRTIENSANPATTAEGPRQALRLRLKPKAAATGFVDGGWWPRSRDLAAELPGLLAVLAVRLGRIERVIYHLGAEGPTVPKIRFDGGVVRLSGYRTQRPDTVEVLGARHRITLLVVPPETPEHDAHEALMAAGHRGNTDDIAALLAPPQFVPPSQPTSKETP